MLGRVISGASLCVRFPPRVFGSSGVVPWSPRPCLSKKRPCPVDRRAGPGRSVRLRSLGLSGALYLAFKIEGAFAAARAARSARTAIAAGRYAEAREPLARWLRAEPDSGEAYAFLAQLALEDGDLAKVTDLLNQARALGYPKRGLERLHAVTLARIGRFAEAEPILQELYEPDKNPDPAVDEALARVYLKTYRLKQAEQVLGQWIRHAPRDGRPYLWLTEYDRRMEVDNSEALETHYRQALERDPLLDAARLGLAETLRKSHRNAEAAALFEVYLARHTDDAVAFSGAGRNDLELGDQESAIRRLDRALALDPRDPARSRGGPRSTSRAETRRKRSSVSARRSTSIVLTPRRSIVAAGSGLTWAIPTGAAAGSRRVQAL